MKGVTVSSDEPKLMQIGEIAERSGLSLRTLRHYDEIGLLTPSARTEGRFRLYTEQDLAKLMIIRRMKPLGYSLDDMQQVMALLRAERPIDDAQWQDVLAEARRRRAELARRVTMADEFIEMLQTGHSD